MLDDWLVFVWPLSMFQFRFTIMSLFKRKGLFLIARNKLYLVRPSCVAYGRWTCLRSWSEDRDNWSFARLIITRGRVTGSNLRFPWGLCAGFHSGCAIRGVYGPHHPVFVFGVASCRQLLLVFCLCCLGPLSDCRALYKLDLCYVMRCDNRVAPVSGQKGPDVCRLLFLISTWISDCG